MLVSGTLQRFIVQSSMDHLVRPLASQGHLVDYYLALGLEHGGEAFRQNRPGIHFAWDPKLSKAPHGPTPDVATVRKTLFRELEKAGGRLKKLALVNGQALDDPRLRTEYKNLSIVEGGFPLRRGEVQGTANLSFLRLFFEMKAFFVNGLALDDPRQRTEYKNRSMIEGGFPFRPGEGAAPDGGQRRYPGLFIQGKVLWGKTRPTRRSTGSCIRAARIRRRKPRRGI